MLLYILISKDKTHFKIGITKNLTRVNLIYKICEVDLNRSVYIQSNDNLHIKLLEKHILYVTKKYSFPKSEKNSFLKLDNGFTEIRHIDALDDVISILEEVVLLNQTVIKFYSIINCICAACMETSMNSLQFKSTDLRKKINFLLTADF